MNSYIASKITIHASQGTSLQNALSRHTLSDTPPASGFQNCPSLLLVAGSFTSHLDHINSNCKELYQTYYIILGYMSNVQVKISTASLLIDKIDKIVEEGYFQNRSEALNEAIRLLIKKYQLSKIKTRIEIIRGDTEKYHGLSGIVESMHSEEDK